MIKCIIIEDEPLAAQQLASYIQLVDFLTLERSFPNAIAPLTYLRDHDVDLIFLDIEMEGLSGIDFLKSLRINTQVILTTAYDQYALDAFELEVTDYLLKPISFERFLKAVNKIKTPRILSKAEPEKMPKSIFVRANYRLQRIDFSDILFIEGKKEYLRFHTTKDRIMTLMSFKKLMQILPDDFIRVHNSYVVAASKIDYIEQQDIVIGSNRIPISGSYLGDVRQTLKHRGLMH